MTKKILGIATVLFAFTATSAFAQTPTTSNSPEVQQNCCLKGKDSDCKGKKDKKDKKHKKNHNCKKGPKINPFEGIALTESQEAQIKALREEQKALKKEQKKASKEAKAKNREAYENKLSEILTPDQLAQYKKNCEAIKNKKPVKRDISKTKVVENPRISSK